MASAQTESNRRAAYRVSPSSQDRLSAAIVGSGPADGVPVEVADVTFKGAAIRVLGEHGPTLARGDRLTLALASPGIAGSAHVDARIVSTHDTPTSRFLHLAFEQNDDLVQRGRREILELFNRRMAFRGVAMDASDALQASIVPIAGAYETVSFAVGVRNISTTGARISPDPQGDAYLRERAHFRILVQLPGRAAEYTIGASVCYRVADQTGIHYGCRFDWAATPEPLDVIEDLAEYMLDRFGEAPAPPPYH